MTKDATVVKEVKDSLEEAIGKEVEFEIKGIAYKLTQATLGDFQKLRGFVRTQRIKGFMEAMNELPDELKPSSDDIQRTLREMASHIMSENELTAEAMTIDGQVFMLWRMLTHANDHFNFTLNEFYEMIDETTMNSMLAVMEGIADEPGPESDPPVVTD